MQAINIKNTATIPYKSGEQVATICSDGEHHAVITGDAYLKFNSLWWAAEGLHNSGFSFDSASFKESALTSFIILCVPRGYYYKHVGVSWHGFKDGKLIASTSSRYDCIVACIRHLFEGNL